MTDQESRRTVLEIASGAIVTGLAGCLTGSDRPTSDSDRAESGDSPSDEDRNESHEDGAHSRGGHGEELDEPSAEATVTMTTTESGDHFDPHVVWVEKGGRVTWRNESGGHSTTAYHPDNDEPRLAPDGAVAWDSGVLSERDATVGHTFDTEGVYHYYCAPHETAGMIGSVIVGRPDPDTQTALAEPPSEKPEPVRDKLTALNDAVRGVLDDDRGDDEDHGDHDH